MHNDRSRQALCRLKDLSPSHLKPFNPDRPDIMTVKLPERKLSVDEALHKLNCELGLLSLFRRI